MGRKSSFNNISKEKTTRRLFLSQIDDSFNEKFDVAIAPRCFLDREDVFVDWENLPFIEFLNDSDDLLLATIALSNLSDRLVGEYAAELNSIHDRAYSVGYLRILLIRWLVDLITASYKSFVEMAVFVEAHSGESFTVEVFDKDAQWNFVDTIDVWSRGLCTPMFNY